jgi:hypothetical protein
LGGSAVHSLVGLAAASGRYLRTGNDSTTAGPHVQSGTASSDHADATIARLVATDRVQCSSVQSSHHVTHGLGETYRIGAAQQRSVAIAPTIRGTQHSANQVVQYGAFGTAYLAPFQSAFVLSDRIAGPESNTVQSPESSTHHVPATLRNALHLVATDRVVQTIDGTDNLGTAHQ